MVKAQLNRRLAGLSGGYSGEVKGVRLGVWRGVIRLRGLQLRAKDEHLKLDLPELVIDLDWGPLVKRRMLVASVELVRPSLRMKLRGAKKAGKEAERAIREKAREKKAEQGERQDARPLPALLEKLMPFRVDRLAIKNGEIFVREGEDEAEAKSDDIQAAVENLTNAPKGSSGPHARGHVRARVFGSGSLRIVLELNPTARQPAFHLTLEVDKLALKDANPLLRSEWGVDVEKGTFDLYAEAQAKDGSFKGCLKPFVEGLKMHGKKDKKPLKVIKEAVIGTVAAVLKSEDSKAVASKVPFEGKFENPKIGIWEAVLSVLRNAFVRALAPSFEKL